MSFLTLVVAGISVALYLLLSGTTLEGLPLRGGLFTLGAGIFEGLYFALLSKVLSKGHLGVQYSLIRGTGMIIVWGISVALGIEALTQRNLAGAFLVLLSIVVIQIRPGMHWRQWHSPLAWAAGSMVAGYHLLYGFSLEAGVDPLIAFPLAMTIRNSSVLMAQGFALLQGDPVTFVHWLGASFLITGLLLITRY